MRHEKFWCESEARLGPRPKRFAPGLRPSYVRIAEILAGALVGAVVADAVGAVLFGSTPPGWLPPPPTLLKWLVTNFSSQKNLGTGETGDKRRLLLERDQDTLDEALHLIDTAPNQSAWYIFEGPSKPDAYLETDDIIIVVEGKRTEHGPTTKTTWMPNRHQMLRHMDCAFERLGDKKLFGFFIVEEGEQGKQEVSQDWIDFSKQTLDPKNIEDSLPHRSASEREEIANAFIGVTTWQLVCHNFGISTDILLETIPETKE